MTRVNYGNLGHWGRFGKVYGLLYTYRMILWDTIGTILRAF